MRKCLFIAANEWPNWGGSELLWSGAAEKLARRGVEVRVSVPYFGKAVPQVEQLRLAGCRISHRRPPSFLYRVARKFFPLPEYVHSHVHSIGVGVDLVVVSQGGNTDGLPWMEATHAAGLKYAVIAEGATDHCWPEDHLSERLAEAYEGASCAYFVSQATLNLSRRQFATPLRKAKVIRNPFNVSYDARPQWPVCHPGDLSLACVGRLETGNKGQDLLLDVLALSHWRERKVRLSLVGRGINERALRCMAEDLKLTSVDFLGHQSNIEEVWSRHHALVLPSRHEGMPLTVVEAMLCGRPCIVTDVAGNRELVRDGTNGFLAKAPAVDLLDDAMDRAWRSLNQLRDMGERAAADVRRWVSADPAEDFVGELEALVE
jgi:glycosyltransferase involved in cell wall biosynthesis